MENIEYKKANFWWDSLPTQEKKALATKYADKTLIFHYYHLSMYDIKMIYESEHPTLIEVEDSSSKEDVSLKLVQWSNDGFPPLDLNENTFHVTRLIAHYKKIKEQNKLLREALELMYNTCNPNDVTAFKVSQGINLGEYYVGGCGIPSDRAIHKAKSALEQTK